MNQKANKKNKPAPNYRAVMLVTCLSASLVPLMGSALNLALPFINADFSLSARASGWIATSYLLSTAIFQIPCARLADIIGRRKVFIMGVTIFLLSSVCCGFAPNGDTLIAFRFLSGLGSAMMFSTNIAILTAAVPAEKRGWALGVNTATVYFSIAAGPFIGGLLTQAFGWHSIFFLAVIISVIVLIGAAIIIKDDWKDPSKKAFDYIGTVIYAAGLFSLIYGFSNLPGTKGIILALAGVLILTLFTFYEKKLEAPVFNINLFIKNRIFRLSTLSALINYSATMCIAFMLSLYLQYIRGLSPTSAGAILVGQSLVMAVVSLMSGKLSDRIAPHKMASIGMMLISLGLICLCFLTTVTPFALIVIILVVIGFGFGIFSSPNMNIIMSSVDKSEYGQASATTGTMRLVGQAFSMGLAMMSMSIYIGSAQISSEVNVELMQSMRLAFIISACLCVLGVFTSAARRK